MNGPGKQGTASLTERMQAAETRIFKAAFLNTVSVLKLEQVWANPDRGLKTRRCEETETALRTTVAAAKKMHKQASIDKLKRVKKESGTA